MSPKRNLWKAAVLTAAAFVVLALLAGSAIGAYRGYAAYVYLSTPVGTFQGKPLTRADFLELLLAREAAASKEAPKGATK